MTTEETSTRRSRQPSCRGSQGGSSDPIAVLHQERIARGVKNTLSPSSLLDFSLDSASWVRAFRQVGIESSAVHPSESHPANPREGLGRFGCSGTFVLPFPSVLPRKYDLITSFGLVSSLSEEEATSSVVNMTHHSDTILFSDTTCETRKAGPTGCKPIEYWVSLFENNAFTPDISADAFAVLPRVLLFRRRKFLEDSLPRPLRLLVLTSQADNACGEIRLFKPLSYLQRDGVVEARIFPAKTKQPPGLDHLNWADLFVLQRIKSLRWRSYVNYAKEKGIPVVFEMDDNLLELPREHPESSFFLDRWLKRAKYSWFLRNAHAVTASTRPLASYLKKFNPNVHLLRNYVDLPSPPPQPRAACRNRRPTTIGYAGSYSHSYDFEPVSLALKRMNEAHRDEIRLLFLGYAPPELALESNFSCDGRLLPYDSFLSNIVQRDIRVGLAPLCDNFFNRCKSNIKFLEYALAGIAGVYSNVGPYVDSVLPGVTGLLVEEHTKEEWFNVLNDLLQDPELQQTICLEAYRFAGKFFQLKDHYREWWDVYVNILLNTRGELS